MIIQDNAIKEYLKNVYFIAGTSCGGKTTISRELAKRHKLSLYAVDEHFENHRKISNSTFQPSMNKVFRNADEFFGRTAEEYRKWLADSTREQLDFVLLDLIRLSQDQTVLCDCHLSYMKGSDGKALKWRDVLQKRGKIRTLRGYGATKALSIDQYNKTLTNAQKLAGKITKYAKHGSNIVKYSQKFFDYTLGGDASWKKIGKDIHKGVSKKFKLPDTISKLYDLKDKNWKSFTSDYNGFRGLEGLAG